MIVNLSLSVRVLIDAEALNMAESVGNYTRHRKAPYVILTPEGYSVIYVPAASGEALAHAYQQILAQIAKDMNLPVTKMDELGYYPKFADPDIVKNWYPEIQQRIQSSDIGEWLEKASIADIERAILETSVVADVAGFLYVSEKQVKRTSAIRFSYMMPTIDAVDKGGAAISPQLHVRYIPPTEKEELRGKQALFYVESGSALYTFTAQLVATDIAKPLYSDNPSPILAKEKASRVKAAVDALKAFVDGMLFGAKRSRYMPLWNVRSTVVAVSTGPVEFNVSPGITRDYVVKTYKRAVEITRNIQNEAVDIYVYNDEGLEEPSTTGIPGRVTYYKASTHTEAVAKAGENIVDKITKITGTQAKKP